MAKAARNKKTTFRNVAVTFAGIAAFVIGLSAGNLANASSAEPITVEPVSIPQVDNHFCDDAPVTCKPYLENMEKPAVIVVQEIALAA